MLALERLHNTRCFLLDMDGTFYLGDQLIAGAKEFLSILHERDLPYYFLTNNSSRNRTQYAQKLQNLGLPVSKDEIYTSGQATASFLRKYHPEKRVICFGTSGLRQELQDGGLQLVDSDPELVVLGFDTTINYKKIWRLCDLIRAGLPFIATHPDINCPVESGFMPDTGSLLALVEASTGRRPDAIIGKPNRHILDALSAITGLDAQLCAMVGDRLYTDMALGQYGVLTVLVLSGETKEKDLRASIIQPDLVVKDILHLVRLMK
jgi:4-nitrophenyl phosphatase